MCKGVSGGGCQKGGYCNKDAVIENAAVAVEEDAIVEVALNELAVKEEDVQQLANIIFAIQL